MRKLSFVGGLRAGDRLLAIQAVAYVDDIDAVVLHRSVWAAWSVCWGLPSQGWRRSGSSRHGLSLAKTCEVMDSLTKGNFSFDVPFVDRKNEIGRIARSCRSSRITWPRQPGGASSRSG